MDDDKGTVTEQGQASAGVDCEGGAGPPDFLWSQARCCMKPRKGARPVPGPIMTIGTSSWRGRRNAERRTKLGSLSPGCLQASQQEPTPLWMRPVGTVSLTTAQVTCRLLGFTPGPEDRE